jgi:REP element-mobilizing transposase RayT
VFELFDPTAEVRITVGNFPHWYQPGVTYFITFRTEDSIPATVADDRRRRRSDWLRRHGVDSDLPDWRVGLRALPESQQREFHATFSREFMDYLDRGHGECALKRPELAGVVARSLRHFDARRYHLGDFVVMPNHVHVLVCLLGDTELESLCYSWKKFTAAEINRALGRKGRFWQEESFDHLVRSPEQFDHLRRYVADNPRKAGVSSGESQYWRREEK